MAYSEGATAQLKTPNLQSAIEDFDPVIGRLETLVNRASGCSDRVVGSRPSEVAGNSRDQAPSPNNLIYAAHARRDRIVRAVDHLESEIQRLENGLA